MKKESKLFLSIFLTILFLLVLSISLFAQKEIPLTTTSPEAKEFLIQARDLIENGDIIKGEALLDKAIALDNTFALAYLYKTFYASNPDVRDENLKNAILYSGYASKGEQLQIEIIKNYTDNNISKARMIEDALIQMFPEDPRPMFYKGSNLYNAGENAKALEILKKVVQIKPDFPQAHNLLGYIYMGMGDYDNAKKELQQYIALVPDYPNPYDSYGELLLKTGDYDGAIKNFQASFDKDKTFQRSLYMIGNAYLFKNDYNAARDYYRKFAEASNNPNSKLLAKRLKSISYVYENNIDEALNNFNQYRDIAETENNKMEAIKSYAYEGLILCESGRTAEALDKFNEYNKRINKMPLSWQEKASLNAYSNLDLAYAYALNNEIEEAKDKVEQAIDEVEKKDDIELMNKYNFTLGLIEYQQGNYNSAVTIMKRINNPNCQQRYYLAQAYNKVGDIESANKLCGEIKNLNENQLNSAVIWNKVKQLSMK